MPKYPYLNDETAFDAASLNDRFDTLRLALNALTTDAFAERALNPVHVPSLIGNVVTAENTSAIVSTPQDGGAAPPGLIIDGLGTTLADPVLRGNPGYAITLTEALTLTRDLNKEAPTALMVMANVEVTEFVGIDVVVTPSEQFNGYAPTGITLNEYTWDVTVVLVLEDNSGTQATLYRTERQVSPRVTISPVMNEETPDPPVPVSGHTFLEGRAAMSPLRDLPGNGTTDGSSVEPHYKQFDHKTYQDVAIRTVLTASDLTAVSLAEVKRIHIGLLSANGRTFHVQRANITAIPLLAEVV